jgi:formimidoylglutamate deiminase
MLNPGPMQSAMENHAAGAGVQRGIWCEAALLPEGWSERVRLTVREGLLASVESGVEPQAGDERCSVAIPGLANLHSHAFQRGMAGLAEVRGSGPDTFWTWREIMYHFLDRLTPDDLEAITAQAYIEMLEGGFTRVGEFHYVHHDGAGLPYEDIGELATRVCAAAQATGINLTLLPVFYAHANFGGGNPAQGQRRFVTTLDQFGRLLESAERVVKALPRANVGVAPHSLRAVTPGELRDVVALAGDRPVHIHAAEQVREVEDCVAATGQRPVEWLLDHAPLGRGWCVIHATHLSPAENAGLAASGATVGLCPLTEANLGDGVFPAAAFLAQGGIFGIGTDSNVQIQAAAELRQLEYSQRLTHRGRNICAGPEGGSTARKLFDLALAGGHRALGCGTPGLAAGSAADVVALAVDYRSLTARERGDTILDRYVFAGAAHDAIDRVWVGGKCLVSAGHHIARERTAAHFRATLRRLL